jgi:hypothetical protein
MKKPSTERPTNDLYIVAALSIIFAVYQITKHLF